MSNMKPERIQKIISNYGQFSRRQVEDFIVKGLVKVNGETATLGDKATIDDAITVKGNRITFKTRHDYYVLNKPKGYICAREDKMGRTAVSLIDNPQKRNLFTIGRLDVGTTGLIIITSDGELANRINSPSSKIKKTYLV
ncbi:MAG: hypothetical protein DRP42_02235 [Tenericutes bacterium]|nr:MAG: hypothetical protein DRP42_02235 [Mycoplasmatota bacterium]